MGTKVSQPSQDVGEPGWPHRCCVTLWLGHKLGDTMHVLVGVRLCWRDLVKEVTWQMLAASSDFRMRHQPLWVMDMTHWHWGCEGL